MLQFLVVLFMAPAPVENDIEHDDLKNPGHTLYQFAVQLEGHFGKLPGHLQVFRLADGPIERIAYAFKKTMTHDSFPYRQRRETPD